MRLHIATLGLHANQRIEHVILKRGADKIILFYTERNKDEINHFVKFFKKNKIPTETVLVHPWKFDKILASILDKVIENKDDYELVEFNGSCGTRIMTAAIYAAASFLEAPVYIVSETETNIIGDIIKLFPISIKKFAQQKLAILKKLDEAGGTVSPMSKLGSRETLKASSISKHVSRLAEMGFVTKERIGRETRVSITDLGRVILRIKLLSTK